MKPLFLTFSPPGWPPVSALRSTSKGLISVESGAEGIIDHPASIFTAAALRGGGFMEPKAVISVRRQWLEKKWCLLTDKSF